MDALARGGLGTGTGRSVKNQDKFYRNVQFVTNVLDLYVHSNLFGRLLIPFENISNGGDRWHRQSWTRSFFGHRCPLLLEIINKISIR